METTKVAKRNMPYEFNRVCISGICKEDPVFNHESKGVKFYQTIVEVKRLSETPDFIPILLSEFVLESLQNRQLKEKWVEVSGKFNSYNRKDVYGDYHFQLYLNVSQIKVYDEKENLEMPENTNFIYLDGCICKTPVLRVSKGRKRNITDLVVCVNKLHGKRHYIPCIAWGKNSKWAAKLKIGTRVKIEGRIQSRIYFEKIFEGSENVGVRPREIYEVSITRIEKVKEL